MTLRILYFARLRERFGLAEETLDFAGATAADLVSQLQARGGVWAEELAAGRAFRVAVNQELVALDAALAEQAEAGGSEPSFQGGVERRLRVPGRATRRADPRAAVAEPAGIRAQNGPARLLRSEAPL